MCGHVYPVSPNFPTPTPPRKGIELTIIAGLAGLRVGYGSFPLSIIEYLWRAKQPYNVSVAAEVAACAALQNPKYLEVLTLSFFFSFSVLNIDFRLYFRLR